MNIKLLEVDANKVYENFLEAGAVCVEGDFIKGEIELKVKVENGSWKFGVYSPECTFSTGCGLESAPRIIDILSKYDFVPDSKKLTFRLGESIILTLEEILDFPPFVSIDLSHVAISDQERLNIIFDSVIEKCNLGGYERANMGYLDIIDKYSKDVSTVFESLNVRTI